VLFAFSKGGSGPFRPPANGHSPVGARRSILGFGGGVIDRTTGFGGLFGFGGRPFGANLVGIPVYACLIGLPCRNGLSSAGSRTGEGVTDRRSPSLFLGVLSGLSALPPSNILIKLPAVPMLPSSTTFSLSSTALKLPPLILRLGLGLALLLAAKVAAMKLAFFPSWPLFPGGWRNCC
jgi:hypothetical protein